MTTHESADVEIETLRKNNSELIYRLKQLVLAIEKLTPESGISRVIAETDQSVKMIQKYEPKFELI